MSKDLSFYLTEYFDKQVGGASLIFSANGKDYITKRNNDGFYCTQRAGHDTRISGFSYKWISEITGEEVIITL